MMMRMGVGRDEAEDVEAEEEVSKVETALNVTLASLELWLQTLLLLSLLQTIRT